MRRMAEFNCTSTRLVSGIEAKVYDDDDDADE